MVIGRIAQDRSFSFINCSEYIYLQDRPYHHQFSRHRILDQFFSPLSIPFLLTIYSAKSQFSHHLTTQFFNHSSATMAPVIRIPTEDTLKTLQNVLKKRIDAKRILKEKEKTIISGEDYQLMRADLNNTHFLQPMDTENTKASIHYIRQKFSKYVHKTWIS